nr:hypothetical protein [Tanacetum cinerariifolium]
MAQIQDQMKILEDEASITAINRKETRSSSTTAHANNSPPEYDSFYFKIEPNQGRLTSVVMNDISDNSTNDHLLEAVDLFLVSNNLIPPDVEIFFEPDSGVLTTKVVKGISEHYILMPNILSTLPTLDPDSDFTPSHDSLGYENKIFDPRIFIEVQSDRLLSREEFSISFIRNPLYPVYDTLLLFSSENEDKVLKPSILSYLLVSHQDKTTSDFSENLMMIYEGDIPSKVVSDLHTIPMDK